MKESLFGDGTAMQLAALAAMGGETNIGKAIAGGLQQSAQLHQQARADAEYQDKVKLQQALPQILSKVDFSQPQQALQQLVTLGLDPKTAVELVKTQVDVLQEQRLKEQQNMMTPYQSASLQLQREGMNMRQSPNAPSGYQFNPDGSLAPIHGGPADKKEAAGKDLPAPVVKLLSEKVETRDAFNSLSDGFKDDYGGYKIKSAGEAVNLFKRTFGDDSGQAQWWQQYQEQQNIVRNKLFGSALTATEKAEFDKANISPSMNPDQIRANLSRQTAIANRAVNKLGNTYKKGSYNSAQIDELTGGSLMDSGESPQSPQSSQNAPSPAKVIMFDATGKRVQ